MDDIQKPGSSNSSARNGKTSNFVKNNFKPSLSSKLLVLSLILVSVAMTASLAALAFMRVEADDLIDEDQYQAVFLQDGQVYIGHMSGLQKDYVQLDDVFYVLPPQNLEAGETVGSDGQTTQQNANQPILAKRGKEIHAPEGTIYIQSDKILFWENMKDEGEVAKTIEKYYQLEASGELDNQQTQGATTTE